MCFIMIFIGILTVDYSLNTLMNGENCINVFTIKEVEDECYQIKIFNKSLYLNINYLEEDFNDLIKGLYIALMGDN